ncbi:MAG: hypothetical protein FJ295_03685 [Planctomycetes bacterium]|nr:hypothetical protein [Planctomycetota bacterium]
MRTGPIDAPQGEQWSGLWVSLPDVDAGRLFVDEPFESFANLVRTHRSANLALEKVCARNTDQGLKMTSLWFPAAIRGIKSAADWCARQRRTTGRNAGRQFRVDAARTAFRRPHRQRSRQSALSLRLPRSIPGRSVAMSGRQL